ncbi:acyl carrier protein [Paracoccus sp. YLB-12]|jgi:acyl carrier protein|uniref:Acyl carrier protein n=1 Tax=Paracoccus maritimus TaxID=2933292 RepID=A0ABT2K7T9_9RHOB|nr:acyl carrier protein [Paracoccus sp. YLB-12]MCT4332607.1 acyl carrier protein [Paracoccus sp. YLB-12]PHQ67352.1 MAG: phosphopantetheine-containing protein [Paracoccus sp. (in: a-proteobacteria)]
MSMTAEDLIRFIRDELNVEDDIDAETELFSTGVLDSVAMMNIIGFVEEKAEIEVRPADVTLENFDTCKRIVDYARDQA